MEHLGRRTELKFIREGKKKSHDGWEMNTGVFGSLIWMAAAHLRRTKGIGPKASPFLSSVADIMSDMFPALGGLRAGWVVRMLNGIRLNVATDIESQMKLAFDFEVAGIQIRPRQVRYEISRLLGLVKGLNPSSCLEIGTAGGGTLFLIASVATSEATVVSVDHFGYASWRIPLYQSFARDRQRLKLIRSDSHTLHTLRSVKEALDNKRVDFLFIDGDHSYEGVKQDFEMYGPLVRGGGLIAFHDIVPTQTLQGGSDVNRAWNEIKKDRRYAEIVEDWKQVGAGIGVLFV